MGDVGCHRDGKRYQCGSKAGEAPGETKDDVLPARFQPVCAPSLRPRRGSPAPLSLLLFSPYY